uniref:Uncharacterized protein n=1 Tax=Cucumis melo TaxID=3656 RepID=A0A9I9EF01_CUCME
MGATQSKFISFPLARATGRGLPKAAKMEEAKSHRISFFDFKCSYYSLLSNLNLAAKVENVSILTCELKNIDMASKFSLSVSSSLYLLDQNRNKSSRGKMIQSDRHVLQ